MRLIISNDLVVHLFNSVCQQLLRTSDMFGRFEFDQLLPFKLASNSGHIWCINPSSFRAYFGFSVAVVLLKLFIAKCHSTSHQYSDQAVQSAACTMWSIKFIGIAFISLSTANSGVSFSLSKFGLLTTNLPADNLDDIRSRSCGLSLNFG